AQPSAPPSERRVANPSWVGAAPSASASAPPSNNINGPNGPNGMAPFRPTNSPRPDGRPVHDNRMPSPKSAYPQHQAPPLYNQHPEMSTPGNENGPQGPAGPPPPPPPPAAAEAAMQRMDDRPPSVGPKRMREWEEESTAKKQANEENRVRLDDVRHRRMSTPPRDNYRRNSSEARRPEEVRRPEESRREEPRRPESAPRHAVESYHPSDAAHHPPSHASGPSHLPPMQQGPPTPMSGVVHEKPPVVATPKEERPPSLEHAPPVRTAPVSEPERAARKMEVDEDYDDSGEDEKKTAVVTNGSGPGSAAGDAKTSTPANAGVNGISAAPKVE
ncbi:hypothetical protein FAUST_11018, partial [Fusarium austroamericanum]